MIRALDRGPINPAVTQLDRMTQQIAALVEEGVTASVHLAEQAARLKQVVDRFRVAESSAA
jgi:methyl-accepting chemotaxis protein